MISRFVPLRCLLRWAAGVFAGGSTLGRPAPIRPEVPIKRPSPKAWNTRALKLRDNGKSISVDYDDESLVLPATAPITTLRTLPNGLHSFKVDLSGCRALERLPDGLEARHLILNGCLALRELPSGLCCYHLEANSSGLRSLPDDLQVEYRIDLADCRELSSLPAGLAPCALNLRNCTKLTALPKGLDVRFLDISGCGVLIDWPETAIVSTGRLLMRGCMGLRRFPPHIRSLSHLDICDCPRLRELPEGLEIGNWLDLANTELKGLPNSLQGVSLRWRGVPIESRIAFHPETITVQEILRQQNAELRRVLLERYGFSRFMQEAKAELLDKDSDPGGERRLLRVKLEGDEDLVCVSFVCPSTGRQYITRVPPDMATCQQAVAWMAGFDDPKHYRPLIET
ncbi:MAG TPA: hypothetical protein VGP72_31840 [Planctomycetota bacterium]